MITADKRKAVFLLHQEGMAIRGISRGLKLSRNAVRRIIAQAGQIPKVARAPAHAIDPDLLRQLHQECAGYAQRMCESAIDAISCHALHPAYRCLSTSGARPDPRWLSALVEQGQPI